MVAIEHRPKSTSNIIIATTTAATATQSSSSPAILSPTSTTSTTSAASSTPALSPTSSTTTATTTSNLLQVHELAADRKKQENSIKGKMSESTEQQQQQQLEPATVAVAAGAGAAVSKSAVSQRNVDIKIAKKSQKDAATQELTKKVLKLDLTTKELDEYALKSPKSPIARLPHQTSLTSSVDVEDRKTLREALYQGIFHRHRRTIFAVGSFLRMLRSRNSQYNTIRSSSEGEDVEEVR